MVFERLTVIAEAPRNKNECVKWLCECQCGKIRIVYGYSLTSGNTKSCGCYNNDMIKNLNLKHGLGNHRLYGIWYGMKRRCYDSKSIQYQDYGGRGVVICDDWLNNFKSFYDWAMANGYEDRLTIERNDNDGNYCPENCSWITLAKQAKNRRNSITFNGECASDACRRLGATKDVLYARIRSGWSLEKAFTTPVK